MIGLSGIDLKGLHWGHRPQITGYKTVDSPFNALEKDFLVPIAVTYSSGGPSVLSGGTCDPFTALIPC